jgi:cytochrome c-type biogenesis protein CcmH/NrfG
LTTSRRPSPGGRRSFLKRQQAALGRADRTKVIGTVFAVVIVCALVGAGLLPVLDQLGQESAPAAPATSEADGSSQFEQDLRREIERRPDNPEPMVSLANLLVAQGRDDEAIEWYERAIELDPDRLQTRLDFGTALARRGSVSDAEVQFKRAIAIDSNSAEAHFLLGELYVAWQPPRLAEARAAFERAIAVQPESVAAERATEALATMDQAASSPVATPSTPPTEERP